MQRHGAAPSAALLTALIKDPNADVRAAVTYVAGVQGEAAKAVAAAALKDKEPVVRRRAAEALVRMGQSPDKPSLAPVADIYALAQRSRSVRSMGRPHRHREHRARGVEGSCARRDQPARRARRDARVGPHRQWREPSAGARQAVRDAEADEPVGRQQAAPVSNVHVYDDGGQGRPAAGSATAVECAHHQPVPCSRRANQSRAGADARLRGAARRDLEDSGGDAQDKRPAGTAAPLPLRAADDQARLDAGRESTARRGVRPRLQMARRRTVHQLRRAVLRLGVGSLRDR